MYFIRGLGISESHSVGVGAESYMSLVIWDNGQGAHGRLNVSKNYFAISVKSLLFFRLLTLLAKSTISIVGTSI